MSTLGVELKLIFFCNLDFSLFTVHNLQICTIQNIRHISLSVAQLNYLLWLTKLILVPVTLAIR